jgi:hypothetical protein
MRAKGQVRGGDGGGLPGSIHGMAHNPPRAQSVSKATTYKKLDFWPPPPLMLDFIPLSLFSVYAHDA